MPCGDKECKAKDESLYQVETAYEGDDEVFVFASSIRQAMSKYKTHVALLIQEDNKAHGIDSIVTAADVEDPYGVTLVASPRQVIL